MGQTDDFLEKVRRLEEEEAEHGQNSKKPDPLGEEHLRREEPPFHKDADSSTKYHSWLILKKKAICSWCPWLNPEYERDPIQYSKDVALLIPNPIISTNSQNGYNHQGYSRWNGANKVAQDLHNALLLRYTGYTNKHLLGYFRSLGYSQKSEEYVSFLDSIEEFENEKRRRWEASQNHSPSSEKGGEGQKK